VRVRFQESCALGLFIVFGVAANAGAQSPNVSHSAFSELRFTADALGTPRPEASAIRMPAPAARQADDAPINGIVFGGLNTGYGGAGFAVGGGVQVANVADREEFGLQFDALFSNVGECIGCDPRDDFSARQFAVAGAFLYKFEETTTGWRPFAGGGVVFTRFSFSFDDDFVCNVVNVDCSDDVTSVGLQAQGGVSRGNLHFEGRLQGTAGGAFIALVGYRFGR
jgi:hypothetical protein